MLPKRFKESFVCARSEKKLEMLRAFSSASMIININKQKTYFIDKSIACINSKKSKFMNKKRIGSIRY